MKATEAERLVEIPDDDPIVESIIEAAMTPYRHRVSPEMLEDMREVLVLFLTTHPEASRAVDSLRPRVGHGSSGQVVRDGATAAEPAEKDRASGDDR